MAGAQEAVAGDLGVRRSLTGHDDDLVTLLAHPHRLLAVTVGHE
jgi:hypothetical protein